MQKGQLTLPFFVDERFAACSGRDGGSASKPVLARAGTCPNALLRPALTPASAPALKPASKACVKTRL
jgi:hypothetical protein